jgi:hypothetical protein
VLLYGSEVWGTSMVNKIIKKSVFCLIWVKTWNKKMYILNFANFL